mmetsp:Transcript_66725/g.110438  ORF Transcript_66725/g.110438 Transcript_66725/m.110438 type:complete len:256 (-) Transcript_66725:762-1529(-)
MAVAGLAEAAGPPMPTTLVAVAGIPPTGMLITGLGPPGIMPGMAKEAPGEAVMGIPKGLSMPGPTPIASTTMHSMPGIPGMPGMLKEPPGPAIIGIAVGIPSQTMGMPPPIMGVASITIIPPSIGMPMGMPPAIEFIAASMDSIICITSTGGFGSKSAFFAFFMKSALETTPSLSSSSSVTSSFTSLSGTGCFESSFTIISSKSMASEMDPDIMCASCGPIIIVSSMRASCRASPLCLLIAKQVTHCISLIKAFN